MLKTRLWMGSVLVLIVVGMLAIDHHFAPWYPFLLVFQVGVALLACKEVMDLLGPDRRPQPAWSYGGVVLLGVGNWLVHMSFVRQLHAEPWEFLLAGFVGIVLAVMLHEMARFKGPGRSMETMALTLFVVAYLGLLPCCFAQLRWLHTMPGQGSTALGLAIFVPKTCDIGAYVTGRLLGRHPMSKVLSPKKTWEGAAGGLTLACITAIVIDRLAPAPLLHEDLGLEVAFGLSVAAAGMLGDLAESMIKRDCQRKDASAAVPGFGGVLDVVDSVVFSAPLTYLWLILLR